MNWWKLWERKIPEIAWREGKWEHIRKEQKGEEGESTGGALLIYFLIFFFSFLPSISFQNEQRDTIINRLDFCFFSFLFHTAQILALFYTSPSLSYFLGTKKSRENLKFTYIRRNVVLKFKMCQRVCDFMQLRTSNRGWKSGSKIAVILVL